MKVDSVGADIIRQLNTYSKEEGTIEDGGGGIIPDRLRWFRKICRFHLICTPISLTAQRNGGTRQRNAFQPLLFAPANAVPFIRGLKRSTIRTAVPIPDRHRSGRRRFHSPSAARLFLAGFNGMGLTPFRPRCGHLPSRGG